MKEEERRKFPELLFFFFVDTGKEFKINGSFTNGSEYTLKIISGYGNQYVAKAKANIS